MDNKMALSPAIEYTYGTICVACMIVGTFANGFAFHYFISLRRRNLSSFLYTCISFVDLLISITVLPRAVSFYGLRHPIIFSSSVICNVWGYSFQSLTLFSVFYVGVLSITRAYVLMFPLYKIKKRSIVTLVVSHLVAQNVLSSLVFWDSGRYVYMPEFVECSAYSRSEGSKSFFLLTEHVINMLTYVLPTIPILLSSVICIWKLYGKQVYHAKIKRGGGRLGLNIIYGPFEKWMARGNIKQMLQNKKDASTTIIVFTIVYAVCNIPMGIYYIFYVVELIYRTGTFFDFDRPAYYVENMIFNLAVPINSVLNPIIYIMRMSDYRRKLIISIRSCCACEQQTTKK